MRSIFLTREELAGKVSSLRRSLVDPAVKFDEQTARELFLFLIQPALGWIKSERLVIITTTISITSRFRRSRIPPTAASSGAV